jgi:hypothetical protein
VSPPHITICGDESGRLCCNVFRQVLDLRTVSLRYFNVFGPRQDTNSHYAEVIPKFYVWHLHARASRCLYCLRNDVQCERTARLGNDTRDISEAFQCACLSRRPLATLLVFFASPKMEVNSATAYNRIRKIAKAATIATTTSSSTISYRASLVGCRGVATGSATEGRRNRRAKCSLPRVCGVATGSATGEASGNGAL